MTRIDCALFFSPSTDEIGAVANAFRVVPDTETEVFLDFCMYAPSTNSAKIVSRVRVTRDFIPHITSRLEESMTELIPRVSLPPVLVYPLGDYEEN